MTTWNKRLDRALKESTTVKNRSALAKAVGVKPATVTDWMNGEIKQLQAKNAQAICKALGLRMEWLLHGRPPMHSEGRFSDVAILGAAETTMPLIGWVKAGEWCESPDEFAPGDAEEWLPRPKNAGPRSFALRVQNDSMTSPYPGQRSYPEGTIIYVDPDKAVTSGARVVARAGGDYTFKVYVEDSGRQYLKPINPQYPTIDITDAVHICGVVIWSMMAE